MAARFPDWPTSRVSVDDPGADDYVANGRLAATERLKAACALLLDTASDLEYYVDGRDSEAIRREAAKAAATEIREFVAEVWAVTK